MKPTPLQKKLSLKKITVANLNRPQMGKIIGGNSEDGVCQDTDYALHKLVSHYTDCENGSCNTDCVHGSCYMDCTPSELCPPVNLSDIFCNADADIIGVVKR